jgi:hypothetical protein
MIETATPIRQISYNTPAFVEETADRVFGQKEFLPLQAFLRKIGLDRKTVLRFVADGVLDVFQYSPGKYRKILISKASFIRFLKATSLREIR